MPRGSRAALRGTLPEVEPLRVLVAGATQGRAPTPAGNYLPPGRRYLPALTICSGGRAPGLLGPARHVHGVSHARYNRSISRGTARRWYRHFQAGAAAASREGSQDTPPRAARPVRGRARPPRRNKARWEMQSSIQSPKNAPSRPPAPPPHPPPPRGTQARPAPPGQGGPASVAPSCAEGGSARPRAAP